VHADEGFVYGKFPAGFQWSVTSSLNVPDVDDGNTAGNNA